MVFAVASCIRHVTMTADTPANFFAAAVAELAAKGVRLTAPPGEYVVNFRNGTDVTAYVGLPDDLSKICTLSRNTNEISAFQNWALRVASGSWGRVNGVSCSQPTLTPPQATEGASRRC